MDETIGIIEELSKMFPRYTERMVDEGDQLHGVRFAPLPGFKVQEHSALVPPSLSSSS